MPSVPRRTEIDCPLQPSSTILNPSVLQHRISFELMVRALLPETSQCRRRLDKRTRFRMAYGLCCSDGPRRLRAKEEFTAVGCWDGWNQVLRRRDLGNVTNGTGAQNTPNRMRVRLIRDGHDSSLEISLVNLLDGLVPAQHRHSKVDDDNVRFHALD